MSVQANPERRARCAENCSRKSDERVASELVAMFLLDAATGFALSQEARIEFFATYINDIRAGERLRIEREAKGKAVAVECLKGES